MSNVPPTQIQNIVLTPYSHWLSLQYIIIIIIIQYWKHRRRTANIGREVKIKYNTKLLKTVQSIYSEGLEENIASEGRTIARYIASDLFGPGGLLVHPVVAVASVAGNC